MNTIVAAGPMSLTQAIREFFNIPQGSMMKEYKALTPQDKAEIKAGLIANGYQITETATATAA